MITLVYGIKNCDTVKKALKWLEENQQNPILHDYRADGLDSDWLVKMAAKFGWENLVNKRSTTWRNLDEAIKHNLNSETALKVLIEQPTLIKRPIVIQNDIALLGFNKNEYQAIFAKNK
ncbi:MULTISPECIES: ArsC family reductase [Mannheimia]|uniref:ArsC family reductase n=1 Tax=Mannheimia pernigra TaxID=111844 RepID=A0A7D5DW45_9PAST|nr:MULTISPECIES: ArsC family reductase [Mannheimia]QHB17118.1 ArsC family reductase [Mannheimia pernigra]QLB39987.1 ArsC family reductase [Mannheimia pernigra]QLB41935.1 ArsC family reductase [Mannheimia pernigra]QTM00832.1 ArsC family reductase [Mannheimia sp. ZY171111]